MDTNLNTNPRRRRGGAKRETCRSVLNDAARDTLALESVVVYICPARFSSNEGGLISEGGSAVFLATRLGRRRSPLPDDRAAGARELFT